MIRFFKDLFRKKYDEVTRSRINFIFRAALNYYEARNKGIVDIPAFIYASDDVKRLLKKHTVNEAYTITKRFYRKQFEKEFFNERI